MFYLFSGYAYVLIAAAVIPAAVLIKYIYKADRLEQEPPRLIGKLVLYGVLSTYVAVILEYAGEFIMNLIPFKTSGGYLFFQFFIIVGPAEEFAKYLAVKKAAWNDPEFNCQFDAVVYSVSAALGFAVWENIKYVFSYGFSTALIRAVTAVPGHACFGVFMGVWLGASKYLETQGSSKTARILRFTGWLMAALVHGLYDYLASIESSGITNFLFIAFIAVMFFICFMAVKRLSAHDRYLD